MKRDMGLIRKILLALEAEDIGLFHDQILEGQDPNEVMFHLVLLMEAGLIKGADTTKFSREEVIPSRITWQGYDFLDAARDDSNWHKAEEAMNRSGGFAFDLLKQVLVSLATQTAKQYLGLP